MKITSQSTDELVLTEGSTAGMAVGILIVAGALLGLFVSQPHSIAIWIDLAVVVGGVFVILFSSSITLVMNKTRGQVDYRKKRLVGGQSATYPIGDIFRIETRKQWRLQNAGQSGNQGGSPPQQVLVAQSVMVFKDGRELALDHQKTSSSTTVGGVTLMGGQGAETAIAAQVAKFLGVPFQEIMPPNMSSGINIQF